jgi:hypothetical protein
MRQHVHHIRDRILNPTRVARGWDTSIDFNNWVPKEEAGNFQYRVEFKIKCRPARARKPESIANEFANIVKIIVAACNSGGWQVEKIDGKTPDDQIVPSNSEQSYADVKISDKWKDHYSHLYEREDQIGIVLSAIQAAISSEWQDRFHVALIGEPAGGKTEILRATKEMLGGDATLEYDATATTQAGAIRDLDGRLELPRILLVEEMEKVDENSLRWMLSVLDHRAEIRKTTFRTNVHKQTKLLCLATVNDYDQFLKMMSGALASRFPNHVYCPRPGRDLLEKILIREVARVKGKTAWIKPTLDYVGQQKITDPRKVISICLCGTDKLLTGEYQKMLDRTSASQHMKK